MIVIYLTNTDEKKVSEDDPDIFTIQASSVLHIERNVKSNYSYILYLLVNMVGLNSVFLTDEQ